MPNSRDNSQALAALFRSEGPRVLATLLRVFRDFDLAEEARSEAFLAALESWPKSGVPKNPRGWLIATGRHRGIDQLRRKKRLARATQELSPALEEASDYEDPSAKDPGNDLLRLVFTCCATELPLASQMALTLREVGGLTTEEIARAFLEKTPTVAQRLVRAKARLRDKGIPLEVPPPSDPGPSLAAVLRVLYLIFNEGYQATSGQEATRPGFSTLALDLTRELVEVLPHPEARGLLGLMILQEARRRARTTPEGDLVPLEEQDRDLWDSKKIQEGIQLVEAALRQSPRGIYPLQAAIVAVHAEAPSFEDTDWKQIQGLYRLLYLVEPTPVLALNLALARAMAFGPEPELAGIRKLLEHPRLRDFPPALLSAAYLLQRAGRDQEALPWLEKALEVSALEPERRFLRDRMARIRGSSEAASCEPEIQDSE